MAEEEVEITEENWTEEDSVFRLDVTHKLIDTMITTARENDATLLEIYKAAQAIQTTTKQFILTNVDEAYLEAMQRLIDEGW